MPPVPTPIPIPTPDPSLLDTSALVDINNVAGTISVMQTTFMLVEQNKFLTIIIVIFLISAIFAWLVNFIGQRPTDV